MNWSKALDDIRMRAGVLVDVMECFSLLENKQCQAAARVMLNSPNVNRKGGAISNIEGD